MTTIQRLIALAVPQVAALPIAERAEMLEVAAHFFPEDLAACLQAEATCLREAEFNQQKFTQLLREVATK